MSDKIASNNSNACKERLWVVSELYYPEETSTGYYLTRIAEGLTDTFNVKVLCGQPNYSARGIRAAKHETHNDVEIFRVAGTTLNKNVIPFRVINMVTLAISVFLHGLRRFRAGDRVLVVTNPPAMPFVVGVASLFRGAAYTLLVHDTYPEILIAVGKTRKDSTLVTIVNYFNRWLYKHGSKIIVVGRDMLDLLTQKTLGLDIPITVIPNWAELETVEPRPRVENVLLKELGIEDKFVFLYAGNIGHPNDIETIVGAAIHLRGRDDIHFVFLGAGAKKPPLVKAVQEKGLKNISVIDPRPRSEQIVFLNACDVAIVSLVSAMKGVSMPSRTYNILAAGKPILALTEPGSEVALVVEEDNVGWHIVPGDSGSFAAKAEEIVASGGDLVAMGQRARKAAVEKYELAAAIHSYRAALSANS